MKKTDRESTPQQPAEIAREIINKYNEQVLDNGDHEGFIETLCSLLSEDTPIVLAGNSTTATTLGELRNVVDWENYDRVLVPVESFRLQMNPRE